VSLGQDGSFVYTPDSNYHGPDSFTYWATDTFGGFSNVAIVNLTVNSVNDVPVCSAWSFSTVEDTPTTLTSAMLLAPCADADGDALAVVGVNSAAHGTTEFNALGMVIYTPDARYTGPDQLHYIVGDNHGGITTGTADITVTPVS